MRAITRAALTVTGDPDDVPDVDSDGAAEVDKIDDSNGAVEGD